MDALSELLRTIKLTGAMFFDAHCRAPWCVRSPPSTKLAAHIAQPGSRVIEFHLIAEGHAYIRVGGEMTPLSAGDAVIVPHGDPHYMGNGVADELGDAEADLPALLRGEIKSTQIGCGKGDVTRLICGYLAGEARLVAALVSGLPHVVRVHLRADGYGVSLERMIGHAVEQMARETPGSRAIVAKLAEVLFTEALRRYIVQLPPQRSGWLAGAVDPYVGRALAELHRQPARSWSLDDLARVAGLSRSSLTDRFTRYLGHAPMAYLTQWRLELAAESLRTSSRSVIEIAGDVGYESEAAFNRAFKRSFSLPPARYRKSWRQKGAEVARVAAAQVA